MSEVGVLCRIGGQEELQRAYGWGQRSVDEGRGKGVVGSWSPGMKVGTRDNVLAWSKSPRRGLFTGSIVCV